MGIPENYRHLIVLAVTIAIAILTSLKADPSFAAYAWVGSALTVLGMIHSIFTESPATATKVAALKAQVNTMATSLGKVGSGPGAGAAILMLCSGLALATIAVDETGCAALKHDAPGIIPAIDCTALVIEDAIAGLGIAEILAKDGPACQLDAEKVIAVLGKAARVANTTAGRQAASGWKPEKP